MKIGKIPYLNGDIEMVDHKFENNIFINTKKSQHVVQLIPM